MGVPEALYQKIAHGNGGKVADIYQHALDALAVVDILLAAVAVDEGQRRGVIGQLDQLCRRVVMFKCYVLQ